MGVLANADGVTPRIGAQVRGEIDQPTRRCVLAVGALAPGRRSMTGFRGATAVVGVGSTDYLKRGTSELSSAQLVLQAILSACADAGADPRSIDGFVSYAGDSSEGLAIGAALGVREVRWSTQVWGGGGGGVAAAVNCAAAAVHSGQADCVAVYRGLSEKTDGRGAFNKGHMGHLLHRTRHAGACADMRDAHPADARRRRGASIRVGGSVAGRLPPRTAQSARGRVSSPPRP